MYKPRYIFALFLFGLFWLLGVWLDFGYGLLMLIGVVVGGLYWGYFIWKTSDKNDKDRSG